jgi:transcriptional regulator with XRE-family HTH domain
MLNNNLFGTFLKDMRNEKGISLRELAKRVNISHSYLSNLENGKKPPPGNKLLIDIANALSLNKESQRLLFDIAAKAKELQRSDYTIPADISKYLYETVAARRFIREADNQGCSNDFWDEILRQLTNKNISQ